MGRGGPLPEAIPACVPTAKFIHWSLLLFAGGADTVAVFPSAFFAVSCCLRSFS